MRTPLVTTSPLAPDRPVQSTTSAAYRLDTSGATLLDDLDSDLGRARSGDFVVVGVPYGTPYRMQGVHSDAANAPRLFRDRVRSRFGAHADRYDFDLGGTLFGGTGRSMLDIGDVLGDPRDLSATSLAGTAVIADIVAAGAVPLILGGDDSVPIACVRAFASDRPVVNVLQIDAHIDFRDEVDGVRDGYSSPMRRISEMPWVGQVVQVGARGTGSARPSDLADALAAGSVVIPAGAVHRAGVEPVLEVMDTSLPWFITFDVDGLDPSIAPGTSCPVPGGLDFLQVSRLFAAFEDRFRLAGIDIVEHFPSLDVRDTTSVTLGRLLLALVGHSARHEPATLSPH